MNEHLLIGQIADHIVKGKFKMHFHKEMPGKNVPSKMTELIQLTMEKKVPPPLISSDALDKAMLYCIKKYEAGKLFLPDLIQRAEYTCKSRDILAKHTSDTVSLTKGKAVLATIIGRDHAHWKLIVRKLLIGMGFKTIDLGNCVSTRDVVRSVKREKPDLLGIATPSVSIPESVTIPSKAEIKRLIADLLKDDCRKNITIFIGGDTPEIESASDVGADYYCKNMLQTVERIRKLSSSSN